MTNQRQTTKRTENGQITGKTMNVTKVTKGHYQDKMEEAKRTNTVTTYIYKI